MATWSGWIQQFLSAAGLPNTDGNRTFLSDWAAHADSSCKNNPIDLSRSMSGSSNCHTLTSTRKAQNYTSHTQAANAFKAELDSGTFGQLLAGFKSGDPFTIAKLPDVLGDLLTWGSSQFESYLENEFGVTPSGSGLGGGNASSPKAHHGWQDLRRSLNHNMPGALRASQRNTAAALRSLSKARKVRL